MGGSGGTRGEYENERMEMEKVVVVPDWSVSPS
jgi:hypothetical protein